MKKILLFAMFLVVGSVFAQKAEKVKYTEQGDLTAAIYYYDNGAIQQEGTFNKDGQLHGVWTSYDIDGKKVTVGEYVDGKKDGKWIFYTKDNLVREVLYTNSKIVNVEERKEVL